MRSRPRCVRACMHACVSEGVSGWMSEWVDEWVSESAMLSWIFIVLSRFHSHWFVVWPTRIWTHELQCLSKARNFNCILSIPQIWKITTLFFFQLLNLQLEIESLKATYKNKAVSLHDVCLTTIDTNNNSCITQSIFDYWQKNHTNIDKIVMDPSGFFVKDNYLDHFLYCTWYVLSFPVLHGVCIIISSTARGICYHFMYYTRYVLSFLVLHEVCIIIFSTAQGMYYHFQYYMGYLL